MTSILLGDINKNLDRNLSREGCPQSLRILLLKIRELSKNIPDVALSTAVLAPLPHFLCGIIDFREGPSQYGHAILDAALTCEGSYKTLYPLVCKKSLSKKRGLDQIAKEFQDQNNYKDVRIKSILPKTWLSIYSVRNKKQAAHYGLASERVDALFALVGAAYVLVNHFGFVSELCNKNLGAEIRQTKMEEGLLDVMEETLLYPIIPSEVVKFISEGPVIVTKEKLTQQEAIGLILYSLSYTQQEYSVGLLDSLLRLSGYPIKGTVLSAQISNMKKKGLLAELLGTARLSAKGESWLQEVIERVSSQYSQV